MSCFLLLWCPDILVHFVLTGSIRYLVYFYFYTAELGTSARFAVSGGYFYVEMAFFGRLLYRYFNVLLDACANGSSIMFLYESG